jgi:hypothetical protein
MDLKSEVGQDKEDHLNIYFVVSSQYITIQFIIILMGAR